MNTPRRRWFRFAFSLRTLFIVVTIFGVWLGWNLKMVRERKAIMREAGEEKIRCLTMESQERQQAASNANQAHGLPLANYGHVQVSVIRQMLGDESYISIILSPECESQLIDRIESAYPEARLVVSGKFAFRDSLYAPASEREPNRGNLFKTGLIEKPSEGKDNP